MFNLWIVHKYKFQFSWLSQDNPVCLLLFTMTNCLQPKHIEKVCILHTSLQGYYQQRKVSCLVFTKVAQHEYRVHFKIIAMLILEKCC